MTIMHVVLSYIHPCRFQLEHTFPQSACLPHLNTECADMYLQVSGVCQQFLFTFNFKENPLKCVADRGGAS